MGSLGKLMKHHVHISINVSQTYRLLVRYLFLLGSQNVDFLAAWAEITNPPKSKQITNLKLAFTKNILFTTGFYKLNLKESNLSLYVTLFFPDSPFYK